MKLLIAVPTLGIMSSDFGASIQVIASELAAEVRYISTPHIHLSRRIAVSQAEKGEFDKLIMIDDDVLTTPQLILRLALSPDPIIYGAYPHKLYKDKAVAGLFADDSHPTARFPDKSLLLDWDPVEDRITEKLCHWAGTGIISLSSSVFHLRDSFSILDWSYSSDMKSFTAGEDINFNLMCHMLLPSYLWTRGMYKFPILFDYQTRHLHREIAAYDKSFSLTNQELL